MLLPPRKIELLRRFLETRQVSPGLDFDLVASRVDAAYAEDDVRRLCDKAEEIRAADAAKTAGSRPIVADDFFRALETFIPGEPMSASAHYAAGLRLHLDGKLSAALEEYNMALRLEPLNPVVLKRRGECRYALGDYFYAGEDLKKAAELRPDDPDTPILAAKAAEAVEAWKKAHGGGDLSDHAGPASIPAAADARLDFSVIAGYESLKERIKSETLAYMKSDLAGTFGGSVHHILLYGPPGCGKSTMARAIARECGMSLVEFTYKDVLLYRGGSKDRLLDAVSAITNYFRKAASAQPAVLLVDELDEFYEREVEVGTNRALISHLASEMDALAGKRVIVVATTDYPWQVNAKLKRHGRFSWLFYVAPPKEGDRLKILQLLARRFPFAGDLDLAQAAKRLDGYPPAEIIEVCEDAALHPMTECAGGTARGIGAQDFDRALAGRRAPLTAWYMLAKKWIEDKFERDMYPELNDDALRLDRPEPPKETKLGFRDIGGMVKVKDTLMREVLYPLHHPEDALKYGKTFGGGILLHGPPGCGKTLIARALAGESGLPFFEAKISDVRQRYHGQSVQAMKEIFEKAKKCAPSILFIDEIEAIGARRDMDMMQWSREYINQFLQELGDLKDRGVILIGATNALWDVDPAIRRTGRFDTHVYVPAPDRGAREQVFRIYCAKIPLKEPPDYDALAGLTAGWSCSDIEAMCHDISETLLQRQVDEGLETKADRKLFEEAIRQRESSLPAWFSMAFRQLEKSGEASILKEIRADLESSKVETRTEATEKMYR
jgi:transitional endoplasmic reticulum ATPase